MTRIAGVDIPENKRLDIGLTSLYGIGRQNVTGVIENAKLSPDKKVKDLTEEDISHIQKALEIVVIEGDLRREVAQHISRLREIGSYRGSRHAKGLPARGQRTRTNARTKRGKRMTIGALKKEEIAKKEQAAKVKEIQEAKAAKEKK